MRRRASTVAGRISAEGTRTAAEGTPAVTAANITAEAAGSRLPVATRPIRGTSVILKTPQSLLPSSRRHSIFEICRVEFPMDLFLSTLLSSEAFKTTVQTKR